MNGGQDKWLSVVSVAGKPAKIKIHGIIGGGFFEEGVTDEQVESDLEEIRELKASVIDVDLASLGGSVVHGMRIFDLLKGNSAEININITGWTASMGAIIAQAASDGKLSMSENAQILFHEARGISFGTASQMEADAINIRNFNSQAETIISRRSGMSKVEARELLGENNSEGIFMLPKQAKKRGLVDDIFKPENNRMAATVTQEKLNEYKIKAKINKNQNQNTMKFNVKEIAKNVMGAVNAGLAKLSSDEKTEKNIEAIVAKSTELVVESLQASVDADIVEQTAKYDELETKYNKLVANPSEGKGTDANLGDDPILTEADKAAKQFVADISDGEKLLMTVTKD